MDERNAFLFYRSFYEAAKHLDKEAQADFMMAVCAYSLDGDVPDLSGVAAAMFALVRPTLETSRKKSASGKNGGSKPKASAKQSESREEANGKQNESKTEANAKQDESKAEAIKDIRIKDKGYKDKGYKEDIDITGKLSGIDKLGGNTRAKRFTPPTLEEVAAYCRERGNSVSPERFIDYYTSNGWKVGRNPMKDWKAAVRNWEKGEKPKAQGKDTGFDTNNPFLEMLEERRNGHDL